MYYMLDVQSMIEIETELYAIPATESNLSDVNKISSIFFLEVSLFYEN